MAGVFPERASIAAFAPDERHRPLDNDELHDFTERIDAADAEHIARLDYAADDRFPPTRPSPAWVHRGAQSDRRAA